MQPITNPHDKLFKDTLSGIDNAQAFFSNSIPPAILEKVNLDTIKICKDSFIDSTLKDFYSDMLYTVQIAGELGYIYILLEHKSYRDPLIHLQLLEYKPQIWRLYLKHIKQQVKSKIVKPNTNTDLPVIISIALYHGKKPWDMNPRFADQMFKKEHQQFKAYIPDFEYILYDLSEYTDDEIKGTVLIRITMLLLKHVFDTDFKQTLPNIFKLLGELSNQKTGLQYIETALRYIMSTRKDVSLQELKTLGEQAVLTDKKKEIVMTLAEKLIDEGMEQGMEKGREGMQKILATQFSRKLELESQLLNNLFHDLSMEQRRSKRCKQLR